MEGTRQHNAPSPVEPVSIGSRANEHAADAEWPGGVAKLKDGFPARGGADQPPGGPEASAAGIRVLVLTNMYPSKRYPFYGAFVRDQVRELEELGHTVSVVAITNPRRGLLAALLKYSSFYVRAVSTGFRFRPDVIHSHYVFPTTPPAIWLKRLLGVPVFVTSHRGDVFEMPFKGPLLRRLTRWCIRQSDRVIAVSSEIRQQIREVLDCKETPITVIDMGYRPGPPTPANVKPMPNAFLFVGLDFRRKGGYDLIAAIEHLHSEPHSSFHVTFVGDFPDNARTYIREHGLESLVTVVGKVPHEEIPALMARHEIFVLPSYSEGLPVAMLESMYAGLAVIASDVGDIARALADDSGLVVRPGDVDGLTDAMRRVLNERGLKERLARNARVRADQYSSRLKALEIARLYDAEMRQTGGSS